MFNFLILLLFALYPKSFVQVLKIGKVINFWDFMDQNLVRPNDSLGFQGHKTSNFSYHTLSSPLKSLEKSQLPPKSIQIKKIDLGTP